MEKLKLITAYLVKASGNNPVITTVTVMLFFIMFDTLEATVEKLIWGDRFEHWLSPIFILCFMSYAGYAVWMCAVEQVRKEVR